jgi:hypothetical protein
MSWEQNMHISPIFRAATLALSLAAATVSLGGCMGNSLGAADREHEVTNSSLNDGLHPQTEKLAPHLWD